MAKFKITKEQYDHIVENIVDETHIESEPFTKYSDKKQEKMAHGKEHNKKGYKNPHLKEQFDDEFDDSIDFGDENDGLPVFPETETGLLDMTEEDYNELLDMAQSRNVKKDILVGAIVYSAAIPDYEDREYQEKMLKTLMEIERKKLSNMETWLDNEIINRSKLF